MSYQTASIIDVLLAYGSRGGALYAAYRHTDNPLLLTDVRWQGTAGDALETHRSPDDMAMVREEREAWAQVALRSTTLRPDSIGPHAPWLQAPLDPREAYDLAQRAQRAREASAPPPHQAYSGIPSNGPGHMPIPMYAPGTPPGFASPSAPGYPNQHSRGPVIDASQSFDGSNPFSVPMAAMSDTSQTTGAWPRGDFQPPLTPQQGSHEVIVIACVEIEMPNLMTGANQDFTRDFARDVALNFNRAAHTIPQTRETRGWMHGARMTLGAMMALGAGSRAATHGEMEHAREALSAALANRTLPYVQMRFAEMSEWAQGVPLPE